MLTPAPDHDPTRGPAGELAQAAIAAAGRTTAARSVESGAPERHLQLSVETGGAAT
jgi:hypothetical protein